MNFDHSVCNGKICEIHFVDGLWVLSGDGFSVSGLKPRLLSQAALDAGASGVRHNYDLKLDREFA